jgi:uncharacterized protein (DUF362 family)
MRTDRLPKGRLLETDVTRREFLRRSAAIGAGATLASAGLFADPLAAGGLEFYQPSIDLAVAKGGSPSKNCLAAVEALGGFGKFVHKGDKVVVKPNPIGSNRADRAINTHPEMVEAVIRECFQAGASEVVALSHDDARSITDNGTEEAIRRGGGTLKVLSRREQFREVVVPRGRILRQVEIATDLLDADVFINMPIAKHHAGSRLTLAMKNLMGVNWNRIIFHQTDLQQTIAELATTVKHNLVIMDANHVLLTNGPGGPGEVMKANQVIAGVDPVAVDAFTTRFFDLEPNDIGHIRIAYELGVGDMELSGLKIEEFAA